MKKAIILLVLIYTFLVDSSSNACTTFCLIDSNDIAFGRNFDFDIGNGFIVTNRRNLEKTAFLSPNETPAKWISKYGSITFNQVGMEFPYGGMNEKGLVVAQMWLNSTTYPEKDKRYAVGELQWIQFQLDNSATVDEVIASDSLIRISNESIGPIQFLVCDRFGNIATIEYLNRKLVYHTGATLSIPILGNEEYERSMLDLKDYAGFGGELQIPKKWKSVKEKNAIGSKMIKSYFDNNHSNIINYSFDILNAVGDPVHTKWSTVFDIKNMKIHFKSLNNKEVRTIRFVDFNFDCKSQSKVLDIQNSLSQNITQQFKDYTTQINLKYSLKTFDDLNKRGFFPVDITRESVVTQAKYPETFKCKDNK